MNKTLLLSATYLILYFTISQPTSADSLRLAYSEKLGVEVFAESESGSWCARDVRLRLTSQTETLFGSDSLNGLLQKVGKVLESECPQASTSRIVGYFRTSSEPIYNATADKDQAWVPVPSSSIATVSGNAVVETKNPDSLAQSVSPSTLPPPTQTSSQQSRSPETSESSHDTGQQVGDSQFFTVGNWSPPRPGEAIRMFGGINEIAVSTKDGSCAVLVDKNLLDTDLVYAELQSGGCKDGFVHGQAKVEIYRNDGKSTRKRMQGFFTSGYFTKKATWDYPLIARYREGRDQKIGLWIDSNRNLNTHYIAELATRYGYRGWQFCTRSGGPHFRVITEDRQQFMDSESIDLLVKTVGTYADQLCESSRQFTLSAGSGLFTGQGTNDTFYQVKASRNRNQQDWSFNPRYAKNTVMEAELKRAQEEQRRNAENSRLAQIEQRRLEKIAQRELLQKKQAWQTAYREYKTMESATRSQRLGYLYGGNHTLKSAVLLTTMAFLQEEEVQGTVLVRVSDTDGNEATVDWPNSLTLLMDDETLENEGWYVVTGTIVAEQDRVDGHGFLNGEMTVNKIMPCELEACAEVNDLVSLVRKRHGDPFWGPDNPPQ